MQGDGRQLRFEQPDILDDQGVDTEAIQLVTEPCGTLELAIVKNGIESNIDPCPKLMGVGDQLFDIGQAVARGGPGAKLRATDVDGIGTMIDGADTTGKIFGRGKEFNFL